MALGISNDEVEPGPEGSRFNFMLLLAMPSHEPEATESKL